MTAPGWFNMEGEPITREHAEYLLSRPHCPSCSYGRMHPFRIDIHLGGFHGYDYGTAWILVCRPPDSSEDPDTRNPDPPPTCGLSVPFTPAKANDYLTEIPTSAMPGTDR